MDELWKRCDSMAPHSPLSSHPNWQEVMRGMNGTKILAGWRNGRLETIAFGRRIESMESINRNEGGNNAYLRRFHVIKFVS